MKNNQKQDTTWRIFLNFPFPAGQVHRDGPSFPKAYENKFPPFQKPRRHYYPSNLFPLWAECYPKEERGRVARAACKYMRDTGAIYCK